jgi:hypothetical protein
VRTKLQFASSASTTAFTLIFAARCSLLDLQSQQTGERLVPFLSFRTQRSTLLMTPSKNSRRSSSVPGFKTPVVAIVMSLKLKIIVM